jgi:hypothetical protein
LAESLNLRGSPVKTKSTESPAAEETHVAGEKATSHLFDHFRSQLKPDVFQRIVQETADYVLPLVLSQSEEKRTATYVVANCSGFGR